MIEKRDALFPNPHDALAYATNAVTGYGQEADRQRTQQTGIDHRFPKPPDFNEWQQILANASEITV